jgi:phenol hydroxylase P0 protein
VPVIDFPRLTPNQPLDQPPGMPAGLPCWVRVRGRRADGFVEFDLSIGDPMLSAELILPEAAFEAFCRDNRVQWLSDEQAAQVDAEAQRWRQGQAEAGDGA